MIPRPPQVRGVTSGFSLPLTQEGNQAETRTLYIPPRSLPPNEAFAFRIVACVRGTSACGQAEEEVYVVESPISALIAGGGKRLNPKP